MTEKQLCDRFNFLQNRYKLNYYKNRTIDKQKTLFYGVKYLIKSNPDDKSAGLTGVLVLLEDFNFIKSLMSTLKYKEFINIFPIEKEYDGRKWECKDYYTTIEYLEDKNLDDIIGDDIDEFLNYYWNNDILHFNVKQFMTFDRIQKYNGKVGLLETFIKEITKGKPIKTLNVETGEEGML